MSDLMGTIEDVKFKILAFLMENGEANASQLEEKAECANKTFLKARQQLERDGLIKKRYEPKSNGGLYAIYYITDRGRDYFEKEAFKKELNIRVESANRDEFTFLKRKILELEEELEFNKIKSRFLELRFKPLPERACRQKLKELGFSIEVLDGYVGLGLGYDEFKPEDIQIKITPEKDAPMFQQKFPLYYPLTKKPQNGYYIFGAYKELEELIRKILEYYQLKARRKYEITDNEWEKLEERIRSILSSFRPEFEDIDDTLKLYSYSKKPNALELFKNYYKQRTGFKESYIENLARESLEYFKSLHTNKSSSAESNHFKHWYRIAPIG